MATRIRMAPAMSHGYLRGASNSRRQLGVSANQTVRCRVLASPEIETPNPPLWH